MTICTSPPSTFGNTVRQMTLKSIESTLDHVNNTQNSAHDDLLSNENSMLVGHSCPFLNNWLGQ
jgi:hypothetical protein